MDKSSEVISNFEKYLKKIKTKNRISLYSDNKQADAIVYKPKDVLLNVSSQLRAIQSADIVKCDNKLQKTFPKYKKSGFLPVNKLPVYEEVSKTAALANKFETQCVTDTQLINIIEDAEALHAHKGMTQEFNSSFSHTETALKDRLVINNQNDLKISNFEKEVLEYKKGTIICNDLNNVGFKTAIKDTGCNDKKSIEDTINTQTKDDLNELLNNCIEINEEDSEMSPSPIFNLIKPIIKSSNPTPLVVTLKSFEEFEKIAVPLIEDNIDMDKAKHLINSQILGKELFIHNDTGCNVQQLSPVMEIIKEKDKKFDVAEKKGINEAVDIGIHNNSLQDEILFSSDEETDYIHKELQDLPFTCALETSFFDTSDVLDKTMYVGFQTASNKSIQISSDSFTMAQSILTDFDKDYKKYATLTEMVEGCGAVRCDTEKIETESIVEVVAKGFNDETEINSDKHIPITGGHTTSKDEKFIPVNINNSNVTNSIRKTSKRNFDGFTTASNKRIKLSEQALARCKKVFQDIDLDEAIDTSTNQIMTSKNAEIPASIKNIQKFHEKYIENLVHDKINDDLIIQEFENIEMSLEAAKSTKEKSFVGFKSASNKNILISNTALEKCQHIFQDIDFNEQIDDRLSKDEKVLETKEYVKNKKDDEIEAGEKDIVHTFSGFKTASNKQIKISEEAMATSKIIFNDLDHTDKASNNPEQSVQIIKALMENDINQPSTCKTSFVSFKTANNKDIKISEDALIKTKNIFKDIDEEEPAKLKNKYAQVFKGFKTASNKQVDISNEAIAKSKMLFQDIDTFNQDIKTVMPTKVPDFNFRTSNDDLIPSKIPFESIDGTNKINTLQNKKIAEVPAIFDGFKTASNKRVEISIESLKKSKKLFQDIDKINDEPFKTLDYFKASKEAVNVSEESLPIGKKKLADVDSIDLIEDDPMIPKKRIDNAVTMFQGFKTASNKAVKISNEALLKSKNLFQDINSIDDNILPLENEITRAFQGFKTACHKAVKISNEAFANSKKIFQDIDLLSDRMPNDFEMNSRNAVFKRFMTDNNKTVITDDQALAKCKKLFEDISNCHKDITKNDTAISKFEGFKTGNNKAVEISEKALATSRKVFEDIGCSQILNSGQFKGFQTVNNKGVNISEQALVKARNEYQETKGFNKTKESDAEFVCVTNDFFGEYDKNPTAHMKIPARPKNDIEEIIDTQVLNDFEETVYTEDFCNSPKRKQRSSSPILSCPRAKKRKFETPYKTKEILNEMTKLKEVIVHKTHSNLLYDSNYKKNKRYTLKDMLKFEDGNKSYIDKYIFDFDFDNLLEFEFKNDRNDVNSHILTMEELKEIFLTSVNRNLIPKGWIENHLQLILWKLISYEIKFPKAMKNICTAKNVTEQLKYRYSKELYDAQRPVLRKILEKDDTSMRTMVLCVVKIFSDGVNVHSFNNTTNIELLLTDGWYSVKASIDRMLSQLVCDQKIVVGTKIATNGAELVNCEHGVAPWEDTSAVRLKLFGNSTRRARWDARLGCHGNAAMLTHLSSVKLDGGKVSKLRVHVTRVYPALYVEKFEDGSTVTRSERLEHLHQMKYEAERQVLMEKLYEEVEKEFADQETQDSEDTYSGSNKRTCLDTGSQIAKMMKRSKDPMEFKNNLTHSQHGLLNQYTNAHRERLLQNIQDRIREKMDKNGLCVHRNVVPVMKIRIAGVVDKNGIQVTKGMMSIWKPNDAIQEIITEGAWIDVMNVVPTAIRYSEIQISAGRQSVFSLSKYKESEKIKPYTKLLKRTCYLIKDLAINPTTTSDYNEIDTVGMIFSIDPTIADFESTKAQTFQNVYLADGDKNIICINFWGGLKKFGFENVLDTGQIVSCTNLQKRAGNTRKSIPQYRVSEFTYFTKTPKNVAAKKIMDDLNKELFGLDKRKFCKDCIILKNNFAICKVQDNENISPYRLNNSDYNITKHQMFIDTPKRNDDFNLTGLDFESTFQQTETQDLSPKSMERKRRVNEKISKLKMYGEPPPLSTIHIINKSKNASSSYKSPLVSNRDVSNSVACVKYIPEDSPKTAISRSNSKIDCSPVISMNKTYVKRSSVNPVKLNFSNNAAIEENCVIDDFAGEFDGSPPLSLD